MPKIDEAVINFAVYEGGTEFLGMAEVSLPDITNLTAEVKGAGINDTFESIIRGHVEAMSLGLNFRTLTKDAIRLFEPKNHQIDLRVAQQSTENTSGNASVTGVYNHTFKTTFECQGNKYKTMCFNFNKLTGQDFIAVENEMMNKNEYALDPTLSRSYLSKLASRAGGIPSDIIESMPARDFKKITDAARNFLADMES